MSKEAEAFLIQALATLGRVSGNIPNIYIATTLNNLAQLYSSQGRWAEAEPLILEALAIRRELFGTTVNSDLAQVV
jgi:tetratricopeptide (TPR) repeat protein